MAVQDGFHSGSTTPSIPLCVDLDGTLIRTDLLHETMLKLLCRNPLRVLLLMWSLLRGKAVFKAKIAESVDICPSHLPYRAEVIDLIHQAQREKCRIVLCTASPASFANAIAEHLGLFDEVLSSSSSINLAKREKAAELVRRFGVEGFDYIGNSTHDLPVFACARQATLVSSRASLIAKSRASNDGLRVIPDQRPSLRTWLKAIRVHQWSKNLLIFVPLLAGHAMFDGARVLAALLAFCAFSLCASAIYVVNDLLDLEVDRRHPSKHRRAFASGAISIPAGALASLLLLLVSFGLALLLPERFQLVLGAYVVATTIYSFKLKRQVIVDVMLLAGLYTTRIIAGAAATAIEPSFWLLALSMFIFLSLALVKRISELQRSDPSGQMSGRGYRVEDTPVLTSIGTSSALAAVVVLAFYIQSETVSALYPAKNWLWLVPVLMLYWTTRLWLKTSRNEINDDPVVFAIKDFQSIVVVMLMGLLFVLAALNI